MSESEDIRYTNASDNFDYRRNSFRDADKYFKSKKTSGSRPKLLPTDYSPVIDLRNLDNNALCPDASRIIKVATRVNGKWVFDVDHGFNQQWSFCESAADLSKEPPKDKMKPYIPDLSGVSGDDSSVIYAIRDIPGLFVLSRVLTYEQQVLWALRCLTEYADADYTNLINLHFVLEKQDDTAHENASGDHTETTEKKDKADFQQLFLKACQQIHKDNSDTKRAKINASTPASTATDPLHDLKTLRWASLGYHYDWTARSYNENQQSAFPSRLRAFASETIQPLVDMGLVSPLISQAGIVNYYPVGSKMGAHIDDAEPAVTCPIVSFSLGLSAVFSIGSKARNDRPISLFLRSGDALIQDGSARLAFHAVPRIIEDSLPLPALQHASQRILHALTSSETEAAAAGAKVDPVLVAEFAELVESLQPQLDAYSLALPQAMEGLLDVLGSFRVNFNVRQVEDPRFGKPSEVRLKFPIDQVVSGVYQTQHAREHVDAPSTTEIPNK